MLKMILCLKSSSIPLIIKATQFGEIDTVTDIINEMGKDPCQTDAVSRCIYVEL